VADNGGFQSHDGGARFESFGHLRGVGKKTRFLVR